MKKMLICLTLTLLLCLTLLAPSANAATVSDYASGSFPAKLLKKAASQREVIFTAAAANQVAALKIGSSKAIINGKLTLIDVNNSKIVPIKIGGRTMVPLRFCTSAMGGKTEYISDRDYITVTLGGRIAKFKINSKTLKIVDSAGKLLKTITMDVAATKVSGRVQIPVRAISEGLGCYVYYNKIRTDELVLVSNGSLSESKKDYYMAQLQNQSKYTFKDSGQNYKITLLGGWNFSGLVDKETYFENPFYPLSVYIFTPVELTSAQWHINATKAQIKELYENSDSYDEAALVEYLKFNVGGKKCVRFSLKVMDGDEIGYMDYFFIASDKLAVLGKAVSLKDDNSRVQFKNACATIQLLK